MRTPRRAVCWLAGLAVVAGITAIPAAASADSGTITIGAASSPQSNVGLLSIQASATTPITSISAQVMSGQTDELDVSDFTLTSGTTTDGTWTVQNAITQQQLALGGYTVDVSATDSGGDSVTGQQASGTFDFVVIPAITLSASPMSISYDDQSVTFSGTVTGTWPDGSTQPLASWPVELNATAAWTASLTTGSDGSFQDTVVHPEIDGDLYFATTDWTSTTAGGASSAVGITATKDPVDLTATLSPAHTDYGKPVTISGKATYQSGSAWKPLSDSTIDVYSGPPVDSGFVPLATATTGTDGSYSLTMTAEGSGTFTVYAGGLPDDYYPDQLLAQATQNVTVSVKYQVSMTKFTASLGTLGVLSVSTCLNVAAAAFPPLLPVQIQYAASPRGPWHTLHTTHRALTGLTCPRRAPGEKLTAQADVTVASAYYRLYYPGSSTYLSASTGSLHRWKYLTKITDFKASPHHVAKGGRITVSGQLREYVHHWKDFAWQRVLILLRPKGSKTWYWIYKVKTGKTGRFTKTFTDPASATWSATYEGGSTHFASGAIGVYVSRSGPASAAWLPAGLRVMPGQAGGLARLGDVMP
jgi:hypothetical protein